MPTEVTVMASIVDKATGKPIVSSSMDGQNIRAAWHLLDLVRLSVREQLVIAERSA